MQEIDQDRDRNNQQPQRAQEVKGVHPGAHK
jgi:hypothetical protein